MNTDDIHGLSGAYAVDAVDDIESARFDSHLASCEACRNEVAGLRAAATELSRCTVTEPSPWLRTSILRQITSIRPLAPANVAAKRTDRTRRTLRPGRWLVGVAAAAVLATGGIAWNPFSSGTSNVRLTATEQVLQAKDAQRYTKDISGATATIVRSSRLTKAVIVTANMPPAPSGKVYELWFQQGTKMVRAGLMPGGQANTALLEGDASTARAVGITVEPAGGSEVPTALPIAMIRLA